MQTSDADQAIQQAIAMLREQLTMETVQDAGDSALAAIEEECHNWQQIAGAEMRRRAGADMDDMDDDQVSAGPSM